MTVRPDSPELARSSSKRARPSWSRPAWGSSRSQRRGAPRHEHSQGGAALLPGRTPPDGRRSEPSDEAELLERRGYPRIGPSRRPHGKAQVLLDGQLLVQEGVVAQHADVPPHGAAVGDEVAAEHERLPGMNRQQAGEDLEQAGLAGPIRAAQMHHLAFADFQTSSCKEGETAGERYGLVETNSRRHGDRPCYGATDAQVTRAVPPGGAVLPGGAAPTWTSRAGPRDPGRLRRSDGESGRCRSRPSSRRARRSRPSSSNRASRAPWLRSRPGCPPRPAA